MRKSCYYSYTLLWCWFKKWTIFFGRTWKYFMICKVPLLPIAVSSCLHRIKCPVNFHNMFTISLNTKWIISIFKQIAYIRKRWIRLFLFYLSFPVPIPRLAESSHNHPPGSIALHAITIITATTFNYIKRALTHFCASLSRI